MSAPALPWMRVPINIQPGAGQPVHDVPGMDDRLRNALLTGMANGHTRTMTYQELFPIQAVVWTELGGGLRTAHDLCIAAPTGSGKTLAYALPVLNALAASQLTTHQSTPHSLGALVVLPTRDLAQQVAAVMQPLCAALGLNLHLAAAQTSLAVEADDIMGRSSTSSALMPVSMELLTRHPCSEAAQAAQSGAMATDVLIATPGRLMAHLTSTPGFTLHRLRFLVVDETDRLLRQSYQDWLPHVISLLYGNDHAHATWAETLAAADMCNTCPHTQQDQLYNGVSPGLKAHSVPSHSSAALALRNASGLPRCVKLVVSATLTRDPSKLQRLALHCPRYIAVNASGHRYQLPKSLQEFKVLCSAARKPITLLALLKQLQGQSCVVFASSLDTTHRLYLLLKAVLDIDGKSMVVECSGHKAAAAQRAAALNSFKSGAAQILVASDVVTRGMDFEGVQNVVNYDAPVYAKTYVHRAGRTARAGRTGRVFTLLRDEDVRHFKAMLRKADNSYVGDYKLPAGAADAMAAGLSAALQHVSELLAAEAEDDRARKTHKEPAGKGIKRPVTQQVPIPTATPVA